MSRVVMVLESPFPPTPERGGGAESQVDTLARYFRGRGIDPLVVVPMVRWGPQSPREVANGLEIVRIPYPQISQIGGFVLLVRLAIFLVRRRRDYEAIHAHIANHMAAVCCLVGRILGKPVVVKLTGWHEMDHGILSPRHKDPWTLFLRFALRRATHVQAISNELTTLLGRFGFDEARIHQIPNAVDVRRFQRRENAMKLRRELGIEDRTVAVFVGRLVREKGLVPFFEAWIRAFPEDAKVALLVVGAGPEKEGLLRLIKDARRGNEIFLVGACSDVNTYLAASDFGVLPSLHEGLSNALLEYMAAGLPVLGSRISGTEDLVTPGENGWLFAPGDMAALEACLREAALLSPDERSRLGQAARRRVQEYAGIDGVATRLAALYGMPLGAPSAAGAA